MFREGKSKEKIAKLQEKLHHLDDVILHCREDVILISMILLRESVPLIRRLASYRTPESQVLQKLLSEKFDREFQQKLKDSIHEVAAFCPGSIQREPSTVIEAVDALICVYEVMHEDKSELEARLTRTHEVASALEKQLEAIKR